MTTTWLVCYHYYYCCYYFPFFVLFLSGYYLLHGVFFTCSLPIPLSLFPLLGLDMFVLLYVEM